MPDLSLNSVEPNACARGEGGNRRAFSLKRLSRAANLVNAEHKELRIRLRAVPLESGRQHCLDRRRSVFGEPGSVEFFPERSVFPHRASQGNIHRSEIRSREILCWYREPPVSASSRSTLLRFGLRAVLPLFKTDFSPDAVCKPKPPGKTPPRRATGLMRLSVRLS